MSETLNFSHYGYRIERELGANRAGGRVTYLATDIDLGRPVVIKQFQFARFGANWSDYDAYKREIEVLRGLDHPGIPRYLNSFQTPDGFCMVQEYKKADPLTVNRSFSPEEIKRIAVSILEILVYLQNRIPPIIHRDIKPDNILVDDDINVYLVDFGFARIGDGEVGVSSVVKGTLGFMPPEQIFNRKLAEASDLYSLGMSLICLLTRTKADDIGQLVDMNYRVKFKHLLPKLGQQWITWLEKMVEPRIQDRFPNARAALKAVPMIPLHPPEVQLNLSEISLTASRLGEKLTHSLEIVNSVPSITLMGTWEVDKNASDLVPYNRQQEHPWITFEPATFKGNQVSCNISVDTSQLMAGMTYNRTLILRTNGSPEVYSVPLEVRTARLPVRSSQISLLPLFVIFLFVLLVGRFLLWTTLPSSFAANTIGVMGIGLSLGNIVGLQAAGWTLQNAGTLIGTQVTLLASACFGMITLIASYFASGSLFGSPDIIVSGLIPGAIGGWLIGLAMGLGVERLVKEQVLKSGAVSLVLLTTFLAISLSIGLTLGFDNPFIIGAVTVIAMILGSLLLNAPLNHAKRVSEYRKLERNRIRP